MFWGVHSLVVASGDGNSPTHPGSEARLRVLLSQIVGCVNEVFVLFGDLQTLKTHRDRAASIPKEMISEGSGWIAASEDWHPCCLNGRGDRGVGPFSGSDGATWMAVD